MNPIQYLAPEQVADILKVSEKTLTNWRHRGKGLPFYKPSGRTVLYKMSDVENYIESTFKDISRDLA
jgi:excisionase family DNA binding protein